MLTSNRSTRLNPTTSGTSAVSATVNTFVPERSEFQKEDIIDPIVWCNGRAYQLRVVQLVLFIA